LQRSNDATIGLAPLSGEADCEGHIDADWPTLRGDGRSELTNIPALGKALLKMIFLRQTKI